MATIVYSGNATDQKPLKSGFGPQTTAEEIVSGLELSGKVIVVTGGHSGIGLETTRVLSNAGASSVICARNCLSNYGCKYRSKP